MDTNTENNLVPLNWLNPKTSSISPAGVAFYKDKYGEYLLKIDEEPSEKQYYLVPCFHSQDETRYRMDLIIKNKDGRFLKRQEVGRGVFSHATNGDIHVDYGSKYKTLVLRLGK